MLCSCVYTYTQTRVRARVHYSPAAYATSFKDNTLTSGPSSGKNSGKVTWRQNGAGRLRLSLNSSYVSSCSQCHFTVCPPSCSLAPHLLIEKLWTMFCATDVSLLICVTVNVILSHWLKMSQLIHLSLWTQNKMRVLKFILCNSLYCMNFSHTLIETSFMKNILLHFAFYFSYIDYSRATHFVCLSLRCSETITLLGDVIFTWTLVSEGRRLITWKYNSCIFSWTVWWFMVDLLTSHHT